MKTKSYKGIYTKISKSEMGYFGRQYKDRPKSVRRKHKTQLSQRGHGKIPLMRIQYKPRLTDIISQLRTHLGYNGKNIWKSETSEKSDISEI